MDYFFLLLLIGCYTVSSSATINSSNVKAHYAELLKCGVTKDVSCFLDVAEEMVEEKRSDLLVQADSNAVKITGRADAGESPSQLSQAINTIITEMTQIFREGLFGFFKSAREGEDDDEVEESEESGESDTTKDDAKSVGESRKKKKKQKLIGLIKLIILGIVVKAKITLLLKALSAALQVKFFLVALAGLILNAARFYLDLKHKHQPQKVIYYEHAQHQHHYEGDDDWGSSGPGGGYWGRSYDEEASNNAQDLAYAKQKPVYKKVPNDDSSFSWFG